MNPHSKSLICLTLKKEVNRMQAYRALAPVQKDRPCGQWDLKWKHESLFKRVFKGRPLRELLEAGLIKMGRRGRSGEQASLHRGASGVTRWPIHGHCH